MANEEQNIRDEYARLAPGLAPDVGRFMNTSNYFLQSYLRTTPQYAASNEYQEKMAKLQEMHLSIFGYASPDVAGLDQMIRGLVTESQILWHWRNLPEYKNMFKGKPAWMSESKYREIYMEKALNQASVQEQFARHRGRQLSEEDINKIFYGGPFSERIREEWAKVQQAEQGYRLSGQRGTQTSGVKASPIGPTQPLMASPVTAVSEGVTPPATLAQMQPAGPSGNSLQDAFRRAADLVRDTSDWERVRMTPKRT